MISWRDRAKSDLDCEPLFVRVNDPFSGDKLIVEVLKRLNGGHLEKGARVVQLFNATIRHLMGLDHERLTYYHNGLARRPTKVHGHVIVYKVLYKVPQ